MGIRIPPSDRPTPVDPWGGAPEPAEAELQAAAELAGLRSMREDGERLVATGVTSLEELMRVTRD